jgi:leader peptidase (prepilin peptidase)/N-methyltransferase
MDIFPYLWTIFGLITGSFLNVCIYRLPRHESIVFPGSRCPHCGKSVRPYDNIPVLSFLLLQGKCRYCRRPISLQYPLVELLSGLAFYACAAEWGLTSPTFVNSIFLSAILVLVFTDYHHQILPNVLTLPGAITGFLLSPFQDRVFFADAVSSHLAALIPSNITRTLLPWTGSLLGAIVGGGALFLVASAYQWVRKRQGLGMGDIKMMAMVGAFLGWRSAGLTIFFGSFLGGIAGILLILFGGRTLQTKLAFGTFLGVASAICVFFGEAIIRWYTMS